MNKLKSLIIISFIGIFASSCTHDIEESITDNAVFSEQKTMGRRSLSEALALAKSSTKLLNSGNTRAASERKIDLKDMRVVCNATRSSTDTDTLMYVFNFEDSLGFAVISANEFTPGLIAITESGYYDPEEEQENEAFAALMESAQQYVASTIAKHPITPPIDSPRFLPDTIINLIYEVSPMVTVRWGQQNFYGQHCPNGTVGCAPLAAAQAMTYLEYPSSIQLTYSEHDIDTQSLNWTNLRKHILYYAPDGYESYLYCTASSTAHEAISRLCRQIGMLMGSSYHDNGRTGTTEYGISVGLNALGLPATFVYYTSGSTITPLNNGHILYFIGFTQSDGGHAWLVDGYQLNDVQILTENIQPGQYTYLHTDVYYNHINWGWDGCSNGFFLDEIFNSQESFCLDNNPITEHSYYNFTNDLKYIELY